MKTFENFFKDDYIVVENIIELDKCCYPKIIDETAKLYSEDIMQIENDIKESNKYLSNDEEDTLIKIIKNDPSSSEANDARTKLIENNINLIKAMAIKAINAGIVPPEKKDEAMDAAYDGFINAINTWSDNKNEHFKPWALLQMRFAIRNLTTPTRKHSIDERTHENSIVSIDSPIKAGGFGKGDNNSDSHLVGDKIEDSSSNIPGNDNKELYLILNSLIDNLSNKESEIIKLYFFGDGIKKDKNGNQTGLTYDEIGKKVNLSKVGVRNIAQKTLAKLRNALKEHGIDSNLAIN